MTFAHDIYDSSVSDTSIGITLCRAVKIDPMCLISECLRKSNADVGCVDMHSAPEILTSNNPNNPVQSFKLPAG